MRDVFIGCVDFSKSLLDHVLTFDCIEIVGIVTKKVSPFNSDFVSLETDNIPCFSYENNNDDLYHWVKEKEPDAIYCFGWSHFLRDGLISIPKIGVIGSHPAALPKNRGRHPTIWALALGLKETASTFFFIDPGVDSGDILDQVIIKIDELDTAATLYEKITGGALLQVERFSPKLADGTFTRIPQDISKATYWRKRNKEDGRIDWRMSINGIYNLVRALTHPYVGAHCVYEGREIKIWKVRKSSLCHQNIEPGKVINVNKNTIQIKCEGGVVELVEHEFDPLPEIGAYL